MRTVFSHLGNFGLVLSVSTVAYCSNTGFRNPNSTQCTPCLHGWMAMRLGHTVWISIVLVSAKYSE